MLHAELLGLVRLVDFSATPGAPEGVLRFLAEAMWYPTTLLPSQGVHWEDIDATSARATLTDARPRPRSTFALVQTVSSSRATQPHDGRITTIECEHAQASR